MALDSFVASQPVVNWSISAQNRIDADLEAMFNSYGYIGTDTIAAQINFTGKHSFDQLIPIIYWTVLADAAAASPTGSALALKTENA